ncbi:MAG: sulfonate ABC transporter permease [Coxiellaceae bacterium]|nr:sulfonate ABC transporter permease [Coxiellaceae bacterium]|tara:strand:+ start:9388 stop:11136 length:1749 start_codon:yes stop_codon:yes gene_type:complete
MAIRSQHTYAKNEVTSWPVPNSWDILALLLVMTVLILVAYGTTAMLGRYEMGQTFSISLSPWHLPYYALRSVLRMLMALALSTLVTFIFGTWAAKSRSAERIIIPLVDILQSVPVLGFLSITVVGFIVLFKGSMLGPECAAIFAIFTAQVWNMILSFYQSVRNVPHDLKEASQMFHLSAWQCFWKIEVPYAMPGLLWNAMMSMSGSWVFLVASEAISVAHQEILLPGVGSYISVAIAQANSHALWAVIITMFIVIFLYDQIIFRPLVAWSEKFKAEDTGADEEAQSWLLDLFHRTQFFIFIGHCVRLFADRFVNIRRRQRTVRRTSWFESRFWQQCMTVIFWSLVGLILVFCLFVLWRFIFSSVAYQEGLHVIFLGSMTAIRVFVLTLLSCIIWVPIGVLVGLHPKASRIVQPIAQFFAAFPANLLFPIVAMWIVHYHLNVNIWVSPLMILGTQWYILFNVIAGVMALPKNMHHAVGTLNVRGWLWWYRFVLPGIFPYLITGMITAAGGAWNISIIAEVVDWGSVHLAAVGLGAYIAEMTALGDFPRIALGIFVMSSWVLLFNYVLWRPLYQLAEKRFQVGG